MKPVDRDRQPERAVLPAIQEVPATVGDAADVLHDADGVLQRDCVPAVLRGVAAEQEPVSR